MWLPCLCLCTCILLSLNCPLPHVSGPAEGVVGLPARTDHPFFMFPVFQPLIWEHMPFTLSTAESKLFEERDSVLLISVPPAPGPIRGLTDWLNEWMKMKTRLIVILWNWFLVTHFGFSSLPSLKPPSHISTILPHFSYLQETVTDLIKLFAALCKFPQTHG